MITSQGNPVRTFSMTTWILRESSPLRHVTSCACAELIQEKQITARLAAAILPNLKSAEKDIELSA